MGEPWHGEHVDEGYSPPSDFLCSIVAEDVPLSGSPFAEANLRRLILLTGDPDRGLALADRLQAGIVHVNDQPVGDEPQMPFGGVKDSGWGRFGGQAAIDEFTELKWVTVQSGTRPFPF